MFMLWCLQPTVSGGALLVRVDATCFVWGCYFFSLKKLSVPSQSAFRRRLRAHAFTWGVCRVPFLPPVRACHQRHFYGNQTLQQPQVYTFPPSFDSVQSGVCIISPVLYANLAAPKYCSLTNPSFVFSCYTKHQSCFSTHATPPTPLPIRVHVLPHPPWKQGAVWKWKAGWLEQRDLLRSGFAINISLFQMVPPIPCGDTATRPAERKGGPFRGWDKMIKIAEFFFFFPRRWRGEKTDAAALCVLLLLRDNIAAVSPISVFIGQSQHSLQKTSIILDLSDSKAIYLFTYT